MKKYFKLMRVQHYLKNVLILFPIIFSGQLFSIEPLKSGLLGVISFSLMASAIYIINDIKDAENDRKHPTKCKRPIAAGQVSILAASVFAAILLALSIGINLICFSSDIMSVLVLLLYISINIAYSFGLKNVPIIDIAILVTDYLLRLFYGSIITGIQVSYWLYLTVISLSFYMGLGKRRNEIVKQGSSTRNVLKYYNHSFLDKNMYMNLALAVVFYALWSVDSRTIQRYSTDGFVWTVPIVILVLIKYSLIVEGNSSGDPIDVLLGDKLLILLVLLYAFACLYIIYKNQLLLLLGIG